MYKQSKRQYLVLGLQGALLHLVGLQLLPEGLHHGAQGLVLLPVASLLLLLFLLQLRMGISDLS